MNNSKIKLFDNIIFKTYYPNLKELGTPDIIWFDTLVEDSYNYILRHVVDELGHNNFDIIDIKVLYGRKIIDPNSLAVILAIGHSVTIEEKNGKDTPLEQWVIDDLKFMHGIELNLLNKEK